MNVVRSVAPDRIVANDTAEHGGDLRPPAFGQNFDPFEVVRILWRRKWIMAWTIAVIVIIAATVVMTLTPRYMATTYVEINPRQARIVDFEAVLSGLPADVATMETEIEVIRSRNLAEKTVEKLGLERVAEFNPALRPPSLSKQARISLLSLIGVSETADDDDAGSGSQANTDTSTANRESADPAAASDDSWFGRLVAKAISLIPSEPTLRGATLERIVTAEKSRIVDSFIERLQVKPQGRSRVIAISFEAQDPVLAAQAANTLSDFYIVSQLEAKFEAAKRANLWLSDRIGNLRREVDRAERAVEVFREKSGLIRGGTSATLTGEQVSDISGQSIVARMQAAQAEARLRQVERLLKEPTAIETAGEVLNSETIRNLRLQEASVQRHVAELSNEYGERHPRMISTKAELADVQAKIRIEVQKIVESLRNEVAVARARAGALRNSLEEMKGEVARLNASEVQLRALEREATASRTLLEQLLTRSKETASQEDFQQPDATIITAAAIPKLPSFPKKNILMALALGVALSVSVLVALMIDRLDYGFRSMDQVERALGISPLGLVPNLSGLRALGSSPYEYVVDNPTSAYAEAVRSLYTNLLLVDVEKRPGIVLFSSALPNEGKSSMVVSLGRLLSLVGQKVVIVDCDLRRPSIHGAFNAKGGPGVVECLTGEQDITEVIQVDPKTGAHFIPAGKTPSNPPDLLDSLAMQKFLKTLARKYDLVLIDSAPILAVSDTLFIGRLADKTVFLVKWAKTRRETAQLAIRRMQEAHCNVAGVLLTMVDVKGHARYSFSDSGTYHGKLKRYYAG